MHRHTIDQAALVAGCSADTIRRAIHRGNLAASKPGGEWGNTWTITDKALEEWSQARSGKGNGRKTWIPTYLWPSMVQPAGGSFVDCQRGVVARFTHLAVSHLVFSTREDVEVGTTLSWFPFNLEVSRVFVGEHEVSFEAAKISADIGVKDRKIKPRSLLLREITVLVPDGVEIPQAGSEVALEICGTDYRFIACPRPQNGLRYIGGMVQQGEMVDTETALRSHAAFVIGAIRMGPGSEEREAELDKLIQQGWDDYKFFGTVALSLLRDDFTMIPKSEEAIIMLRIERLRPGYPDPRFDFDAFPDPAPQV